MTYKTKNKKTKMMKTYSYQTGKRKDLRKDRKTHALPAGKRETAWGTTYFESRRNHSDLRNNI